MHFTFIIFLIIYALYWGTIVHLISNVRKFSSPIYKGILTLILFSLIPDTVNFYNFINSIASELPALTYSTFLPFGLFFVYYQNKIISSKSTLLMVLFAFHLALAIITVFEIVNLGTFNSMLNFSANLFGIGFSTYHFYQLFKSLEVPNLLYNSLFWISTALFCYNAGTIFLQILQPVFTELGYFYLLWPYYQIILILYVLVLNYAIGMEFKYGDNQVTNQKNS